MKVLQDDNLFVSVLIPASPIPHPHPTITATHNHCLSFLYWHNFAHAVWIMWLVQQIKPPKKQYSRSLVSAEQLNCCFQQTQTDKGDSNLSCADGICSRQKLVLTSVVIILPCGLNYFLPRSKRATRKKILTLCKCSSPNRSCFADSGTAKRNVVTQI